MKRAGRCRPELVLAIGCCCSALGCTPGQSSVTRIVDSEVMSGRYISPEAYSSYARGAYLEARGDLTQALQAFSEAARRDPDNPDAWVRRGAVLCALRQAELAEQAFDQAERLDVSSASLWRERARCALAARDLSGARAAAERSAAHEPDSVETTRLLAHIYDALGLPGEADRWLDALVAWQRNSPAAWQAVFDHAAQRADRPRLFEAAKQLLRLRPERRDRLARALPEIGVRSRLDRALLEGRLRFGQAAATEAGVSAALLAVRAAALGKLTLAKEQAERVLAADPRDADAWVALAASTAELSAERWSEAHDLRPPSPLSVRLMAALLADHAGADAARSWLSAWPRLPAPADALEAELASHLGELTRSE